MIVEIYVHAARHFRLVSAASDGSVGFGGTGANEGVGASFGLGLTAGGAGGAAAGAGFGGAGGAGAMYCPNAGAVVMTQATAEAALARENLHADIDNPIRAALRAC